MIREKTLTGENSAASLSGENELILYNDDFNTFDFVIDTLVDVCGHDTEQAEQCTLIVHYKGKCAVKKGDTDEMLTMKTEMTHRGLTVEIE